ncbi:MAG: hypothetical protein ACOYYJ_09115 [Chloroflexota bacterium]
MNTNHSRMLFGGKFACTILILTLLALDLSACGPQATVPQGEGPKTWIEYPPEGEVFTMGAIPITIYAANPAGVSSINVNVGGQGVPVGALKPLVNDSTLVRADLTWQPPGEGKYVITAAAGGGAPTSLHFCVVTCAPVNAPAPAPGITDTPSPAPAGVTVTPPTITLTPETAPPDASTGQVTVEFYASPPYVNAGNCATLHWDVSGTEQVYLDGAFVYFRGMQEYCPCETETHTLRVVKPDGASEDHYASIEAYGSCSAPPVTEPPTEPPPSDTDGPSVDWSNLVFEGCQFYGQAGLSDASGVSWAKFYFNKNGGGWKSVWMSEVSSGAWQSEAGISLEDGIGTPMGTIEYYITASDTLGNESEGGGGSYNYTGCGG